MYFLHSFPTSTTIKLLWHDSCFTQMKARLSAVVFPELGGEQMRPKKQEGGGRERGELEPGPCRGGWVSDSTCLRWENNAPLGLKARGRLPETTVPDEPAQPNSPFHRLAVAMGDTASAEGDLESVFSAPPPRPAFLLALHLIPFSLGLRFLILK